MTLKEFAQAVVDGKPLRVRCGDGRYRQTIPTSGMSIVTVEWELMPSPPPEKTLGEVAAETWDNYPLPYPNDTKVVWEAVATAVIQAWLAQSINSLPDRIDKAAKTFGKLACDYREEIMAEELKR